MGKTRTVADGDRILISRFGAVLFSSHSAAALVVGRRLRSAALNG